MECDSGASHNVLSMRSYKQIWPKGKGPSLHKKKVKVIMADGSRSKLPIHSMKCSLVASNGKKVHLYFYVMDGPHNLLGRSGLISIWPKEYMSLKNIVEAPLFKIPADFQVQSPSKSQRQSVAATVRASAERTVCSSGLARVPDLPQGDEQYPSQLQVPADFTSTAVRQSTRKPGKKVVFTEGETVLVYNFKTNRTTLGTIKRVMGNNTYSVDCGMGPQHVSGDALSKSTLLFEEEEGQSRLTAQDSPPVQDDLLDQKESDVVIESDSDTSDDEVYGIGVAPAVAPRRRRIRQLDLGPVMPTRLRQRH